MRLLTIKHDLVKVRLLTLIRLDRFVIKILEGRKDLKFEEL